MFEKYRNVLVVAAHPDDEVLGCGGTIAKLVDFGAFVHVAFLADGVNSRIGDHALKKKKLIERREASKKACRILGVTSVSFDDYDDNRLDLVAQLDIAKKIEILINKYKPEMILTHHFGDVNVDHKKVHQAIIPACRPQKGNPVRTVLCFEVLSSTEWQFPGTAPAFTPNLYFDISDYLIRKIEAMKEYSNELKEWPHSRSIKGIEILAQWRGLNAGVTAAEAFILTRHIS